MESEGQVESMRVKDRINQVSESEVRGSGWSQGESEHRGGGQKIKPEMMEVRGQDVTQVEIESEVNLV